MEGKARTAARSRPSSQVARSRSHPRWRPLGEPIHRSVSLRAATGSNEASGRLYDPWRGAGATDRNRLHGWQPRLRPAPATLRVPQGAQRCCASGQEPASVGRGQTRGSPTAARPKGPCTPRPATAPWSASQGTGLCCAPGCVPASIRSGRTRRGRRHRADRPPVNRDKPQ